MKPLAPNTLLQNRYLIVNLIGKGGMGEVYLAVDQRLGSAIALKRTFFSDDEILRNAFEREARTLARLRHGVLPKVSDHFTEAETQYLIMEHISGDDLAKRLEITQKPFPVSWVLFWADQLLDALNYLHTHEPPIIHRDIKPQNLKLTDDNSIVLLDFGLSKNSTGQTKINTSGSVVGFTPHFAPMEQIRGIGTDARSDIYSLSATFYQLLTNIVPPDALSRADFIISGLADPIKPINEINPEVTPRVSEILLKGMEVSLEKRYPNAREMQKALREAFVQLQNGTSAKTIPSIPDDPQEVKVVPLTSLETELMSKPTTTDYHTRIQPEDGEKVVETEPSSAQLPITTPEEPDFDATLPINLPLGDLPLKQSDVKTEVLLAGSIPELSAAQEAGFPPKGNFDPEKESVREDNFSQADDFESESDFAASDNFAKEENISPVSTVPETVDAQPDSMFDSVASADEHPTVLRTKATVKDSSSAHRTDLPPAVQPSQPKTKSKQKSLAVVGVLGAFFLLLISGAAIGLYFYQKSGATTEVTTPTPTAKPTIEATPTAQPTLESVTNNNSSNENSLITNTGNTNNEQPENTSTLKTTETPKPVKTVEPTPAVRTTPKPAPQVATPKPTTRPTSPKATPLPRILP
ncbi:MAG: protein kinase [Acidobacteriota bacterium]|nr:protein kinase [Acidobacteriota bacterium]